MQKKFAEFTISTHTYKVVEGHSILVDVAVPKKLLDTQGNAKKKAPICVELHGGWLVSPW